MAVGIDPKVDIVFKKLFGTEENAPVLIDLLTAVVQPTRPITGLEFVPTHAVQSSLQDKLAVADVRARDQGNRQFHLEMQRQMPWYIPKRLLFNWARFHPEQLREGENSQTLRPTIGICFGNQALFADLPEHHLIFRLREVKHDLGFCEDLEMHLIELPKFTKTVDQLSGALDRWCYFLRHGAELDLKQLPASLDVPMLRRAMEVLTVFTQDELERAAYEERLKLQLDMNSLLFEHEQQLTAAKERGVVLGQIRAYQEILKQPQTPEAELIAMSPEDLTALLAQLRKQLLSNGG